MPVTVRTCDFKAESWSPLSNGEHTSSDPLKILQSADPDEAKKCEEIFQCSTSKSESPEPIVATPNGLIHAVVEAWNRHHNLVLRPDDFWLAIVSQLSFYITAHAEILRPHFVEHKGKKKLFVEQDGRIDTVDYGLLAGMMADEVGKNVKDPELKDWVLPSFSTTTPEDKTVAAVLFMGAMQKYFEYFFDCITCGVPEIIILGEREDWVNIQDRLDMLLRWGEQAKFYLKYLTPIFKYIVRSFDDPTSEETVNFWKTMVQHHGPDPMSGAKPYPFITGWITGLFLWNTNGSVRDDVGGSEWQQQQDGVKLDKVYYQRLHLDSELIPAVTSVPVTVREIDDFGNVVAEVDTRMVAGVCGFKPCDQPSLPSAPAPDSQSSTSKSKSKKSGSGIWRRLSSHLKSGHKDEIGGDAGDNGSGWGTGNANGGSKEEGTTWEKPSDQNTVKPVAFWWIYKVKEGTATES